MHTYVHNANYVFVLSGGRVKNYQPASQDPRMESLREENHPALRQRGLVEPDAKRSVDDVLDTLLKHVDSVSFESLIFFFLLMLLLPCLVEDCLQSKQISS